MSPESRRDELAFLSTLALIGRANDGDEQARDALYDRYLPRLRRWARGRLPTNARGLVDTDGIVRDSLHDTFGPGSSFRPEESGAFLGYVRRAVDDRIVDEVRKVKRRPSVEEPASGVRGERRELYERAFQKLNLSEQAAVAARLEEGMSYEDIAQELGKSNAEAARTAVSLALVRLAQEMKALRARSQ